MKSRALRVVSGKVCVSLFSSLHPFICWGFGYGSDELSWGWFHDEISQSFWLKKVAHDKSESMSHSRRRERNTHPVGICRTSQAPSGFSRQAHPRARHWEGAPSWYREVRDCRRISIGRDSPLV